MVIMKHIPLPSTAPGTQHSLVIHHFKGSESTRSAYIQAGMHADEHPGLLVAQHLLVALQQLEAQGRIKGGITVIPYANPVGMGQQIFGQLPGRYHLATGENFNRNFADITSELLKSLNTSPLLANDIAALKARFVEVLGRQSPNETMAAIKYTLLREALQHDILLDLHCDTSSVLHIYSNLNQRDRALSLAASTGVQAVFLEEEAGGFPLDEAYAKAWKQALDLGLVDQQHLGFSATIELRGQADVDDQVAAADAAGILGFLHKEGLIDLEHPETDFTGKIEIYPLEGVDHLKASGTGIVAWKKQIGDPVTLSEVIAEVVPLDAPLGTPRMPILSTVTGILVARHHIKLARSGQKIGLLAGPTPLAGRQTGKLMGT